ncbi:hypothetical protein SNE40_006318 [Patella caerulea]|uniref:Uncharacterized protein n=1 Tax=Patella caerulea TaxID=87958 RepID=A0AAN8K329_PATCE
MAWNSIAVALALCCTILYSEAVVPAVTTDPIHSQLQARRDAEVARLQGILPGRILGLTRSKSRLGNLLVNLQQDLMDINEVIAVLPELVAELIKSPFQRRLRLRQLFEGTNKSDRKRRSAESSSEESAAGFRRFFGRRRFALPRAVQIQRRINFEVSRLRRILKARGALIQQRINRANALLARVQLAAEIYSFALENLATLVAQLITSPFQPIIRLFALRQAAQLLASEIMIETTMQPMETTMQPMETTMQPMETTMQPMETTMQPMETTMQPMETTMQPMETTMQPMDTTTLNNLQARINFETGAFRKVLLRNAAAIQEEIARTNGDANPSLNNFFRARADLYAFTLNNLQALMEQLITDPLQPSFGLETLLQAAENLRNPGDSRKRRDASQEFSENVSEESEDGDRRKRSESSGESLEDASEEVDELFEEVENLLSDPEEQDD